MPNDSGSAIWQILKWIWNTLFHQILAVVTVYAIWIPIEKYVGTLSWHAILCTLGALPLMAESLMLFSESNVWSQELDKLGKRFIHIIMICLSFVLVILGIILEISLKAQRDEIHFSSAHSIMGLVTMIFLFFGLVGGILISFAPLCSEMIAPVWFKIAHNIFGQLGYIMGLVCLILGFYTDWFVSYTSEASRYTATGAIVIIIFWSLFCSWKALYRHFKSARPY